jgi:4-carboxymuconolactone decarboxylase
MTRIVLMTPEQTRNAAPQFVDRRGELAVFRLLANAPQVFAGWTQMVEEVLDSPTFTARMRELVTLRVGYLQSSSYEIGQHRAVGRDAGIPAHQLDALTCDGDLAAGGFDATERAVVEFVTELCATNHVRDDVFATTRDALGEQTLTELLMLVSLYYGLALVLNAADLELDKTARLKA